MRHFISVVLALFIPLLANGESTCVTTKKARVNDDYLKIAQATGGSVQYLEASELASTGLLNDLVFLGADSREEGGVETGPVNIALFDKLLSESNATFSFEVDPSVSKVYLNFSASEPVQLSISKPDGALLRDGAPGVQFTRWSAGCAISITLPSHGLWKASFTGSGTASVQVKGRSSIRMEDLHFVAPAKTREETFWDEVDAPQSDREAKLRAVIFGAENLQQPLELELRTFDHEVLQRISLVGEEARSNYLTDSFRMERRPVRAYLVANDESGKHIERVFPQALIPSVSAAPDTVDEYGVSALMRAVQQNDLRSVRELLGKNAEVNSTTVDGDTALMMAVEPRLLPILRVLLEHGADVNVQTKFHGTALFKATVANNPQAVNLLLQRGAAANIRDGSGYTAYEWAKKNGYQEIIQLLANVPHQAPHVRSQQ